MWSQPGRGSLTGSRTRCTVHLGSFASRRITHISTDSCTSLTARTSSGNGIGCSNAPRPGRQSLYSDLQCHFPGEFRTEGLKREDLVRERAQYPREVQDEQVTLQRRQRRRFVPVRRRATRHLEPAKSESTSLRVSPRYGNPIPL